MRASAPIHQTLRSVVANPERMRVLSAHERDELLRRLRELESLEERALAAYDAGHLRLAERLDAEYAEKADELEGMEADLVEGESYDDREPDELAESGWGMTEGPVHPEVTGELSALYERYLRATEESRPSRGWSSLHDEFDPETLQRLSREQLENEGWHIETPEDVLALRTRWVLEHHYGTLLPHVPPEMFLAAVEDAFERRSELRERYRESAERRGGQPEPNPGSPKTERVFHELVDELGDFDDFGWICFAVDPRAAEGGERQYAYCKSERDKTTIAFAPKSEQLPRSHLLGLMMHEIGHALDFRYPRRELCERLDVDELPEGVERRADAIAEAVFGVPIEYDERDVQCVGCGGRSPRPDYLAQNPG